MKSPCLIGRVTEEVCVPETARDKVVDASWPTLAVFWLLMVSFFTRVGGMIPEVWDECFGDGIMSVT